MSDYISVTTVKDMQGSMGKCIDINGVKIALFKVGEEYFAIDNTCPHRDGPLADGFLQDDVVSCPWHGWQFNVKTGESIGASPSKLNTYPVKVEGDEIQVLVESTNH
jgi:nitrite reductase (NADH) small subunit